ncbi:hypothetical protein [Pedobacter gandavensis]|uniref:hypothetical protein n=1 Tax=Pedobacter gandavensis TaxID=2679963 RepID=UPI00292E6F94|nr:hypothetical protein [Pedobacter gandavensis]
MESLTDRVNGLEIINVEVLRCFQELHDFIGKGFEEVNNNLVLLHHRVGSVEERLDKLDDGLNKLEGGMIKLELGTKVGLDQLGDRVDQLGLRLSRRIDSVENKLALLKGKSAASMESLDLKMNRMLINI